MVGRLSESLCVDVVLAGGRVGVSLSGLEEEAGGGLKGFDPEGLPGRGLLVFLPEADILECGPSALVQSLNCVNASESGRKILFSCRYQKDVSIVPAANSQHQILCQGGYLPYPAQELILVVFFFFLS